MKKIVNKLPARSLAVISYALLGVFLAGTLSMLLILVIKITPEEEWKWLYALYVALFSAMFVLGIFLAGFERAKLLYSGQTVDLGRLTWPRTVLPQSKTFFYFHGAHELGGGWVVATFQKVEKETLINGPPQKVRARSLFCVLAKHEWLPQSKSCYVKLGFDQHSAIRVSVIPNQVPELQ